MSTLLKLLTIYLLGIPCSLYGGMVVSDMWGWFIVPLGMMQISILHAWGLNLMMAGWTFHQTVTKNEDQDQDPLTTGITLLLNGVIITTVIYFHGYVISQYLM